MSALRDGLTIHSLTPDTFGEWGGYCAAHADATLFHELGWKRAVERAFGHRSIYLLARRADRVVGILPLFEIRSVIGGRFLLSVPYATYGGIVADDASAAGGLFEEAKRIAAERNANTIEMRSIRAALPSLGVERTHAMFRKALPAEADAVLATFPRKARAAARRASERYDLTVEFDHEALPIVWRLYVRSMRRLGSVNYPYAFFEALVSSHGERSIVQLVRYEGRPVAGLLTFIHRRTVLPYFAGMDERADVYGLNNYLYWQSMRWGVESGYALYDFGRTRVDNTGCFDFKRLCGFEPTLLEFQNYVMPGRTAPDLAPSSAKWAMARRVWRSLPLPVTQSLGGWLAKSIPG